MSQGDNQNIQERTASTVAGDTGNAAEGSHRILIDDPSSPSNQPRNSPPKYRASATSPTFKSRRRKSSFRSNDVDSLDDDDGNKDDDGDHDYNSEGSKKRKGLKKRQSYKQRVSSDDDVMDGENRSDV